MNTQPSITFKAKLGDDLRRWTACGDTTFAEVHQRVSDLFKIPLDSVVIRYSDDEGDLITMVCDEDLSEAIAVLSAESSTKVVLRLQISSRAQKSDTKPPAHCPKVEQAAKKAEKAVAHAAMEAEKAALAATEAAKAAAQSAAQMAPDVLSNIHAELAKAGLDHAGLQTGLQTGIANMHAELAKAGLDQAGLQTHLTAAIGNLQDTLPSVLEQVTAALTPRSQIHSNVTCDACNMHPLVGTRYKKRGENYDLCENDFNKLSASEKDQFLRIDHPQQPWRPQRNPQPCSVKPQARFVEHVNLPDGTEILPGTEFTKIWRLKNTGDKAWPENTRLVFTGGDKFVGDDYAEVAPAPAGSEVEVAISLTAPTEPGRYVSYWRLAVPPAMKKFGQRIWVQVLIVRDDGSVTFEESEQVQHENVQCDICDAVPILGERFHKKGEDYDMCAQCFNNLDEQARRAFELIARPGDEAVDMDPADELEARHGWDAKTVAIVQASPLAALVEGLQTVLSNDNFKQLTQTIEPVFAVPEKFMTNCLKSIEPVLATMSESNAQVKLLELHDHVKDVIAHPKKHAKAAKQMAKAANAEMKKVTKQLAKEAKKVAKHMGKAMKKADQQEDQQDEEVYMEMQDALDEAEVVLDPYSAQDVYGEEEMQDAIDAVVTTTDTAPVCSMQEALAEMGIQQADLTTSMFAEIEQVVSAEAEAAAAKAEAEAIAQSEIDAAMAEAQAAFEASLEAAEQEATAAAAEKAEQEAAAAAAEKAAQEAAAAAAAAEKAEQEAAAAAAAEKAEQEAAAAAAAAAAEKAEQEAAAAAAAEKAEQEAAAEAAANLAAEEAANADAEEAHAELAEQLVAMGFEAQMALTALVATNGNMDEAINIMLQQPPAEAPEEPPVPAEPEWHEEWDQMLEELVEMGFECESINRTMISEHKGNLKDAVKGLIDHERANRKAA